MEQESKVIIDIETMSAESSVKELKDNIKLLRDALVQCQEGTEEYSKIVEALVEKETRLNQVMKAGKSQVEAAKGSYNALVNEMQALKKVWKETTDVAERKALGKQIKAINNELKDLDESIGDNHRNVGNYTASIIDAFNLVGGSSKGLVSGIVSVDKAMHTLTKNPLVFWLSTLMGIINGVTAAFKDNEALMNKMKTSAASLKPMLDALNVVFEALATGIATTLGWLDKFFSKYGDLTPEAKKYKEQVEDQIELDKEHRKNIVLTAKWAQMAAEQRAKAYDEENYSLSERQEALERAQALELKIAKVEKEEAEGALKNLQMTADNHKQSTEYLNAEAEAIARVYNASAKYSEKVRENQKELRRFNKKGIQDATTDANELLKIERDRIEQQYKLAEEGSKEQLELARQLRKKDYEIQVKGYRDKITNKKLQERAIRLATEQYNSDLLKLELEHQKKLRAIRQQETQTLVAEAATPFEKAKTTVLRLTEDYNKARKEGFEKTVDEEGKEGFVWDIVYGFKSENEFRQYLAKLEDDVLAAKIEMIETINAESNQKGLMDILSVTTSQFSKDFKPENSAEIQARLADFWGALIDDNQEFQEAFLKDYVNSLKLEGISEEKAAQQRQAIYEALFNKMQEARKNYNDTLTSSFIADANKFSTTVKDSINVLPKVLEEMVDAGPIEQLAGQVSGKWRKAMNMMALDADHYKDKMGEFAVVIADETQRAQQALIGVEGKLFEYIQKRFKDAKLLDGEDASDLIKRYWPSLPPEVQDAYIQAINTAIDAEAEALQRRVDIYQASADAIQSIMSNIFDYYQEDIDWQVKQGEITEEEGKRRFENLKTLQVSEAVIRTIGGAVTAFMNGMEFGYPYALLQAATVTAAGIAEIQKIRHTEYGSSSSNGGSSITSASQPVMPNFTPAYTQNITGQDEIDRLRNAMSEANLWVNVTDINKAQDKGRVRVAETTF